MSLYSAFTLDVARARARTLAEDARLDQLARDVKMAGLMKHERNSGRVRPVVAAALRRISVAAGLLENAACRAASHVDGQTA